MPTDGQLQITARSSSKMKSLVPWALGIFVVLFSQTVVTPLVLVALALTFPLLILFSNPAKFLSTEWLIVIVPPLYWIANICLHSGTQQFVSPDFYRYDGKLFVTWYLLAVTFLVRLPSDEKVLLKAMRAVIVAAFIVTILGFVNLIARGGMMFNALFSSHNAGAGFVGGLLLILAILNIKYSGRVFSRRPMWAIAGILLVAFMMAQSRAFLLALAVALGGFLLKSGTISLRKPKTVVISAIGFIVVVGFAIAIGFANRFEKAAEGEDRNVLQRFEFWVEAIHWFGASPLIGIGIGGFNDVDVRLKDVGMGLALRESSRPIYAEGHAHNIVLHIAAEQGIIGLIVFFGALFFVYRKIRRAAVLDGIYSRQDKRMLKDLYQWFFIYLGVASLVDINFFPPSTAMFFYFVAGFALNVTWREANALKARNHDLAAQLKLS